GEDTGGTIGGHGKPSSSWRFPRHPDDLTRTTTTLPDVRPRFYGKMPALAVEYHITQYDLEQGALEIQYIEEFFGEFPRKKTAAEIVRRLKGRAHLILLATAPLSDDPGTVVPVSFKVAHEIRVPETEPKLID